MSVHHADNNTDGKSESENESDGRRVLPEIAFFSNEFVHGQDAHIIGEPGLERFLDGARIGSARDLDEAEVGQVRLMGLEEGPSGLSDNYQWRVGSAGSATARRWRLSV